MRREKPPRSVGDRFGACSAKRREIDPGEVEDARLSRRLLTHRRRRGSVAAVARWISCSAKQSTRAPRYATASVASALSRSPSPSRSLASRFERHRRSSATATTCARLLGNDLSRTVLAVRVSVKGTHRATQHKQCCAVRTVSLCAERSPRRTKRLRFPRYFSTATPFPRPLRRLILRRSDGSLGQRPRNASLAALAWI